MTSSPSNTPSASASSGEHTDNPITPIASSPSSVAPVHSPEVILELEAELAPSTTGATAASSPAAPSPGASRGQAEEAHGGGGKSPYVEWRLSGIHTPGSAVSVSESIYIIREPLSPAGSSYSALEGIIFVDQEPPIPINQIPRRLASVLSNLDSIRRQLWMAFAKACEAQSTGPVSRRIAAALGETSLPGTPIEPVTEKWIATQELNLREVKDEISDLQSILYQYIHARKFVQAHGHFDRSIPMCGQAHVDALGEKLQVLALDGMEVERTKREIEVLRAKKRMARIAGYHRGSSSSEEATEAAVESV